MSNHENIKVNHYSERVTSDSLFIQSSIQYFIDSNFPYFNNFNYYNIPLSKVTFWVNKIYYSPDSLKIIATVINREPNNYDTHSPDSDSLFYYDGFAIIGYRTSIDSPLIAYKYPYCTSHGWESYQEVLTIHKKDFEINLKNDGTWIWDWKLKNWVVASFDYNVTDSLFWTNSALWKRGTILPGYYTFEVDRYVDMADIKAKQGDLRKDGINLEYR